MIRLDRVTKRYKTRRGINTVLDKVSFSIFPGGNVGILGRNGSGKSTLLRVIGGAEMPNSGSVFRQGRISWPIGFTGGFQGSLNAWENLRFTCRIYGADIEQVSYFVEEFAELKEYMYMPIKTYSSGMRAKLAFGLSMALNFDYYLIDEITAVGDASFRDKCEKLFGERKETATLVVVSHNINTIKKFCDIGVVLNKGNLICFDTVDDAVNYYLQACKQNG